MSDTGLIIAACAALFVGVMFWLPMRSTRKARGRPMPTAAGLPKKGRAIAYFYSAHCGNCRHIAPLIDQLAEQGQKVFRFDAGNDIAIARELGIRVVPTVALVEDGIVVTILAGDRARRVRQLSEADW